MRSGIFFCVGLFFRGLSLDQLSLYLNLLILQNLLTSQKQEAAKHCNCTMADVENALAKFTWAKEAQRKIEKLKQEGKPMPKSLAEVLFRAFSTIFSWFRYEAIIAISFDMFWINSRQVACLFWKKYCLSGQMIG